MKAYNPIHSKLKAVCSQTPYHDTTFVAVIVLLFNAVFPKGPFACAIPMRVLDGYIT